MKQKRFYFRLMQLFSFWVLLSITYTMIAQIRTISPIYIPNETEQKILLLLKKKHHNDGKCSKLIIEKAHLSQFKEVADYGPMWYGDTIDVNQDGFLIRYEYNKSDSLADKSKARYISKDWFSSEKLFVPYDHSTTYRMYTCRFGGVPPSHGFAHRREVWNEQIEKIIEILKNIK